jgi:mono/diheme cytochrome c family protein
MDRNTLSIFNNNFKWYKICKNVKNRLPMKSSHFKNPYIIHVLPVIAIGLISFSSYMSFQQNPWVIDAKYKTMKNPVKFDDASITAGKNLWIKNCASCHGKTGLGDGVMARKLATFSGDFTASAYQNQTDGEIFGKTKEGRDEMPGYGGKLSDEDIWHTVNYSRTFKK